MTPPLDGLSSSPDSHPRREAPRPLPVLPRDSLRVLHSENRPPAPDVEPANDNGREPSSSRAGEEPFPSRAFHAEAEPVYLASGTLRHHLQAPILAGLLSGELAADKVLDLLVLHIEESCPQCSLELIRFSLRAGRRDPLGTNSFYSQLLCQACHPEVGDAQVGDSEPAEDRPDDKPLAELYDLPPELRFLRAQVDRRLHRAPMIQQLVAQIDDLTHCAQVEAESLARVGLVLARALGHEEGSGPLAGKFQAVFWALIGRCRCLLGRLGEALPAFLTARRHAQLAGDDPELLAFIHLEQAAGHACATDLDAFRHQVSAAADELRRAGNAEGEAKSRLLKSYSYHLEGRELPEWAQAHLVGADALRYAREVGHDRLLGLHLRLLTAVGTGHPFLVGDEDELVPRWVGHSSLRLQHHPSPKLLQALFDGEVDPSQALDLLLFHLEEVCPECAGEIRRLQHQPAPAAALQQEDRPKTQVALEAALQPPGPANGSPPPPPEELLRELLELPPVLRFLRAQVDPRLHSRPFVELLADTVLDDDEFRMSTEGVHLARVGVVLADKLDRTVAADVAAGLRVAFWARIARGEGGQERLLFGPLLLSVAREWVEETGDDPGARGLIETEEARHCVAAGHFHDAVVSLSSAVELFEQAGQRWRRIRALHQLATALGLLGRLEETVEVARQAMDLVEPEEEDYPLAVELKEGLRIAEAGPDDAEAPDGDGR